MGAGESSWHVLCGDVFRLVERGLWGAPFSVVFLDPPYAMDAKEVARLVEALGERGQLSPDCLVLYERSSKGEELSLTDAQLIRTRKMASSCIDLIRMGENDE